MENNQQTKSQSQQTNSDYASLADRIIAGAQEALGGIDRSIEKGKDALDQVFAKSKAANTKSTQPKPRPVPLGKKNYGKFSGPFGMILSVFCLIMGIVGIGSFFFANNTMFNKILFLVIGGGSFIIGLAGFFSSNGIYRRYKRFPLYVKQLKGRAIIEVSELAEGIKKSPGFVRRDITKMIDKEKRFPEGRFSEDGQTLVLTREAWKDYCDDLDAARRQAEADEAQRQLEAQNPIYKEVRIVLEEGEASLLRIQAASDGISSVVVQSKLERLTEVVRRIFAFIQKNPNRLMEIRRFMGYYLPTTIRLVETYSSMDQETVQSTAVIKNKKEIEDSLDVINDAFEHLLDSFYEDSALDISTDIAAMKSMMAQDGLTSDDPFKKK